MSTKIINQTPFLRTAREFPEELHQLTVEVNRSYVDVANAVNSRVIGIYPVNRSAQSGESWYFTSSRQQSFRQVYPFTTSGNIDIGFKISSIAKFSSRSYGAFTDGTNWYGVIFGSNVAISGQLSFFIASTVSPTTDQIQFRVGAGSPAISSGYIVLEWISNV